MALALNPVLADRIEYPYAVGVRLAGDSLTNFTHFKSKGGAAAWASMFQTEGNEVTLWVALVEPEYLMSAVVPGWRQVTEFYL